MSGPDEYVADVAEGITRVEDLPQPQRVCRKRSFARAQVSTVRAFGVS